jgi:hypothetical protein
MRRPINLQNKLWPNRDGPFVVDYTDKDTYQFKGSARRQWIYRATTCEWGTVEVEEIVGERIEEIP